VITADGAWHHLCSLFIRIYRTVMVPGTKSIWLHLENRSVIGSVKGPGNAPPCYKFTFWLVGMVTVTDIIVPCPLENTSKTGLFTKHDKRTRPLSRTVTQGSSTCHSLTANFSPYCIIWRRHAPWLIRVKISFLY
jgi:hypothetical protein